MSTATGVRKSATSVMGRTSVYSTDPVAMLLLGGVELVGDGASHLSLVMADYVRRVLRAEDAPSLRVDPRGAKLFLRLSLGDSEYLQCEFDEFGCVHVVEAVLGHGLTAALDFDGMRPYDADMTQYEPLEEEKARITLTYGRQDMSDKPLGDVVEALAARLDPFCLTEVLVFFRTNTSGHRSQPDDFHAYDRELRGFLVAVSLLI